MQRVKYNLAKGLIGVVADTHIPTRASFLPPALFSVLQGVGLILHAGDLVDERVLDELRALAPVEAVAGNMDPIALKTKLGMAKVVELGGGINIGLVHGGGGDRRNLHQWAKHFFQGENVKAIVFGHSHKPFMENKKGMLIFNPGSAGDPRWGSSASCGLLQLQGGMLRGEIVTLRE